MTMKVDRPGIYALSAEAYHAQPAPGPALGSSGAVAIMRHCPARFWWNSDLNPLRELEDEAKLEFGTASHIAMLEPDQWATRIAIVEAYDWRTKAAQEKRNEARAAGLVPILEDAAIKITMMRAAIDAHPIASKAFVGGRAEASIIWQDRATGSWAKARPDYMPDHRNYLIDYKTVVSAHPRAFERHAYDMGYHQQAAWYLDGLAAVTGKRAHEYWFVCQEREPPFLVSVCRLAGDAIEWGAKLNRRALEIFAECVAANEWPGYRDPARPDADRAFDIGLPAYAAFQLAEREESGEFDRPRKPSPALLKRAAAFQAPLEVMP